MANEQEIKKGQMWRQGPNGKRGTSRTVRVQYVWTAQLLVDVVPVDETDGRRSTMKQNTLRESYTLIEEES